MVASHTNQKFKTFDKVVDNKSIVIDVGANLGYYTLYSSKIAGVFAFEPMPAAYRLLH